MELIDTHCHLYAEEFVGDLPEVIQRAENEGVIRIYLPAIDSRYAAAMKALEARYPDRIRLMAGLHPCSVKENYKAELQVVEEALAAGGYAAVGEIGLDFYWDRTFEKEQYEAFRLQTEWAKARGLPIVIHSRQAMQETIDLVRSQQDGRLRGIFHCFNDLEVYARQIVDLGFYLGIGGVITYKKSVLPEALRHIGLEHLVLETDAPYLPPVPFRGKRNESSYLRYVVAALAEVKMTDIDQVAATTTQNALKIFGN